MTEIAEFALALEWADVPELVRSRTEYLLRDFAASSVAGRVTRTARIAADYAAAQHPGDGATSLFDGRPLGPAGAAWANGVSQMRSTSTTGTGSRRAIPALL